MAISNAPCKGVLLVIGQNVDYGKMKQVDENNVQMGESSAKDVAVAGYPLPWAKSFCPFRACCLYPLLWAKSFEPSDRT